MKQAIKLAKEILAEMGDKRASQYCRIFRKVCFLPHPQPECEGCKYLNGLAAMREEIKK